MDSYCAGPRQPDPRRDHSVGTGHPHVSGKLGAHATHQSQLLLIMGRQDPVDSCFGHDNISVAVLSFGLHRPYVVGRKKENPARLRLFFPFSIHRRYFWGALDLFRHTQREKDMVACLSGQWNSQHFNTLASSCKVPGK